jgi:hypothetical protein
MKTLRGDLEMILDDCDGSSVEPLIATLGDATVGHGRTIALGGRQVRASGN